MLKHLLLKIEDLIEDIGILQNTRRQQRPCSRIISCYTFQSKRGKVENSNKVEFCLFLC